MADEAILIINSGSSSLKFGLYIERDGEEQPALDGLADGIGRDNGKLELKDARGKTLRSESVRFASEDEALSQAARWLAELSKLKPVAVGHRLVHGGPRLLAHQLITPEVLAELQNCLHFAPLHIPTALRLITASEKAYPQLPQFACFDTAFHTTIPEVGSRFALPRPLFEEGIHRYGFHGLSYESIVFQLGAEMPGRTVIAHLGNGASLAAVKDGRSVDTSMGLTPTGGIAMATRSGDLDPGVLLYLLRVKKMNADSLEHLLNGESGLAGISGGKSDMRDLESAAAGGDQKAQMAIEIFGNGIRKVIAAYAAVLGGLDMLVFSGGIGEHSAPVRSSVCNGLGFLGVSIDDASNQSYSAMLSTKGSKVSVRIVPSQEDLQIARHSRALLHSK
ncbi:MAG TPA: acetate/propionate family kinase [Candidatus Acidoferrales bacterium]|nr:acetate/propionate family kinase [Candidatus Acidoferrales bacterium]